MSGRPNRDDVERWADEVAAVGERIGSRFARSEPRRRAVGYDWAAQRMMSPEPKKYAP